MTSEKREERHNMTASEKKAGHSALPWRVFDEHGVVIDSGGSPVRGEDDYAYMVKAANYFPELVEALEFALPYAEQFFDKPDALNKAKAILKKARAE